MSASGLDLARAALASARAAARKKGDGAAGAAKRTTRRTGWAGGRGSGRDPVSLGDALAAVGQDRGWQEGTRVGSLLDRWTELVPDQVARAATPERFDQDKRVLHLRPVSQAAASMLRWTAPTLTAQINRALGSQALAGAKVLPVAAARADWSAPARDCPAITPATPGYVPGLKVGGGAPMPAELKRWREQRRADREQQPLDEARTQIAEIDEHHRRRQPGGGDAPENP